LVAPRRGAVSTWWHLFYSTLSVLLSYVSTLRVQNSTDSTQTLLYKTPINQLINKSDYQNVKERDCILLLFN